MPFGLGAETVEKMTAVFARHPAIEKVVLYGSRAKGTHKPGSDIDMTLIGESLTRQEWERITEELDGLDLPYIIDLSVFAWLSNSQLREHIERVGRVFYSRAPAR